MQQSHKNHPTNLSHPSDRSTDRKVRRARRLTAISGAVATLASLTMAACGGGGGPGNSSGGGGNVTPNIKPAFVVGTVGVKTFDGNSDDLLTAGLGKDGLSAAAPAFANPNAPTAAELRRNAIWTNYRAIVDVQAAGGYGSLYGPNVDALGNVTGGQGKIPGTEYIAFADDGTGQQNVTVMAQVPDSFDIRNPCIISATSSGSRGIYGGIAVGEWGLKRNCAVAYTDKGTGAAPHDLDTDTVPLIDGTRQSRSAAGKLAQFTAQPGGGQTLAGFTGTFPHRLAFKHAHSQQNPEASWGANTLQAIQFTMWAINDKFGQTNTDGTRQATFTPANVLVIASAVSNGGGAAIAAAEQDTTGLIDGVAVGEPNVNLPPTAGVIVKRGGVQVAASGKHLYDYTTIANLYQLCAAQDTSLTNAPMFSSTGPGLARCASLVTAPNSKVTGGTASAQTASALAALHNAGWESESDELFASLSALEVASSISVTYANAYSRASVTDRLCNYSFASPGGATATPVAIPAASLAGLFSTGNGVPPTTSVTLMNDANPSGPMRDFLSNSPSNNTADANLDGALCLRNLFDNTNPALMTGIGQTYRTGNLGGRPSIIVQGRSDGLLPVNHTSRPYLGLNKSVEGNVSKLSYIEVTNGQHFDGFIDVLPGYAARYIPMHVYLNRALDAVYANLRNGTALPASQVVRTTPRGGVNNATVGPQILPSNVPPIAATPAAADAITVSGSTVNVPN